MNLKKLKGVFWAVLAAMLISAVYCPATFAETNSLPAFRALKAACTDCP